MTLSAWWRTMPAVVRLGFFVLAMGVVFLGVGVVGVLLLVTVGP